MKEFTKKHGHKFLLSVIVIGGLVLACSYLFWQNRYVILQQPSTVRAAVITITSPTTASPSTMMINKGTTVVWQNDTKHPIKLAVSTSSGQNPTVQPASSYSMSFSQAGTVTFTFGKDKKAHGSLIVNP